MSLLENVAGLFAKKPNRNQRRIEAKGRSKLSLTTLEDRITPDAKVFTSPSLAVQVGATYTGANAILDAANNALTLDGYYIVVDTVNAPVGGYTPGNITKNLTLWGSNHGIDPNTGSRVPEVFINTSASRFGVATGRSLAIDGFSFVTSGGIGAFFTNSTNNYSLVFSNNIVKNQNAPNVNGVQLGVGALPGINAATISHNLFDGITTGSAIRISTSTNAAITDNVILNSGSGMQIQASLPDVDAILINNNYISDVQLSAIRLEGNVNNPTVTNNTINNANLSNSAFHAGIRLATNFTAFGGTPGVKGTPTVKNNLITNTNTGVRFTEGTFVDITGTAISQNAISVNPGTSAFVTGDTADGNINLSGNWFGTASQAGLQATVTGARSYVIQSYLSGNANSRAGATSTTSGVWGFSPNLATVEMLVPQTKATSLLTYVDGSIQSGINLATPGQRVRVASDTFTGNVSTLANTVTLTSNGQVTVNGNLSFNSDDTLSIDIGGTNPATQYTNFVVNGTINLGNATLAVSFVGGYVVPPGTFPSFNILNNDAAEAVVGTFSGQAEGSTITSGGTTFTITYQGGANSNDVVLLRDVAPTDIAISNNTIPENNPINAAIGNFSTTDADVGDTFTYTLVSGAGSSGNGNFNISGNTLQASTSFDFEAQSSYSIRVRTTDFSGLWFEKVFVITILDVNEAPTDINLSNNTVNWYFGPNTVIGTLTSVDPDTFPQSFTYALVPGAGSANNGLFNISGNQLRVTNSFALTPGTTYTVRIRTTDNGGLSFEKAFNIIAVDVYIPPPVVAVSRSTGTINTIEWQDAAGNMLWTIPMPAGYGAGLVQVVTDRNGDGYADLFVGSNTGTANRLGLVDGKTGVELWGTNPFFAAFKGGVNVTVGDLDGDGTPEVIVGAGPGGGPNVRAFKQNAGPGYSFTMIRDFFAYSSGFSGGVSVAVADVNRDGFGDIITGTGTGSNNVRVFSKGQGTSMFMDFYAFSPGFRGGVKVGGGDVNGDGYADIIVATQTQSSQVRVISGNGPYTSTSAGLTNNAILMDFTTSNQTLGVQLFARDFDRDGKAEIVTMTTQDVSILIDVYEYNGSLAPTKLQGKSYIRLTFPNAPVRIG